ncbi:MAG: radical SAM family heme chaperone HemW [Bacteroidota bacterium]
MSGIYIHIPFCKQACHYCDFHFSTNLAKKEALVSALHKELVSRKAVLSGQSVQTIYFGGGTPSVLEVSALEALLETIYGHYDIVAEPEITLEANPDDLSQEYVFALSKGPVNRLSIGVQSFFDEDLTFMNRAHSADEAIQSIRWAKSHFDNISIDLIYGIPGSNLSRWEQNIRKALTFDFPHISSYALTVEPKTALKRFIEKGLVQPPDEAQAEEQFHVLLDSLKQEGYVNYEISNFGRPGFFSKNNTAYWQGKPYLGIGPSAHSFDGKRRSWNVGNNTKYINAIENNEILVETEELSKTDRYNEYVMTGLRTIWGVSLQKVATDFGANFQTYLLRQAEKYVKAQLLFIDRDTLFVTKKGKFLVDGIASDLFLLNLRRNES